MPHLIPYQWKHMNVVESREGYPGDSFAKQLEARGPAFTAVDDEGYLQASAGVAILWSGVGEVWASLGEWAEKHKFFVIRSMKKILHEVIQAKKLHRVHAYVRCEEPSFNHLMLMLGFKHEATLMNYFREGGHANVYVILPD